MGKATIIEHLGNGLYSIRMQLDVWRIKNRINQLLEEEARLINASDAAREEVAEAEAYLKAAQDYLNEALGGDIAEVQSREKDVSAATSAALKASQAYSAISVHLKTASMELAQLEDLPDYRDMECWCADWTGDLSGDIGTVEIGNTTGGPDIQIRPGYGNQATYSQARDGTVQPVLAGTPAAVFYNAAMRPGVEKWRPQYAHARITAKDDDTGLCTIEITDGPHSGSVHSNVTVSYMTCGALVFVIEDRVLVQFDGRNPDAPVIIGFETNPRPCVSVCLYIDGLYSNIGDVSGGWLEFYDAWVEKMTAWNTYYQQWSGYYQAWSQFYYTLPAEMQGQYADTFFEIVEPRWEDMTEQQTPLQEAWSIVSFFNDNYTLAFLGTISYMPDKSNVTTEQGSSTLETFSACIPGGVSEAETPEYGALVSPGYVFRYLLGDPRMGAKIKVWWNPVADECGIVLTDVWAEKLESDSGDNPIQGHDVYLDDTLIGTRTPTGVDLNSHYIVANQSHHVARIMTHLRMPSVPTGTVPDVNWAEVQVPDFGLSTPPAAYVESVGTTGLAVFGCSFNVYVEKLPVDEEE